MSVPPEYVWAKMQAKKSREARAAPSTSTASNQVQASSASTYSESTTYSYDKGAAQASYAKPSLGQKAKNFFKLPPSQNSFGVDPLMNGDCVYVVSNDKQWSFSVPDADVTSARSPRPLPTPSSPSPVRPSPPPYEAPAPLQNAREVSKPAATASIGYLGYTSFSSVYEETENVLYEPGTAYMSEEVSREKDPSDISHNISRRTLETCLRILASVPEPTRGFEQFRNFTTPFDTFPHMVAKMILRSLYDTLGQYLGKERNLGQLEMVARKLCSNTARVFSEREPDAKSWINQFIGENLRWESIGILFAFWDLHNPEPFNPRYTYRSISKFTGWQMGTRESLRLCLEICTEFSSGTSLLLYVSQKHSVAESMFSGDASLRTWRAHCDTVALATFLGLHAEQSSPTYEATLSSEFRRCIFHCVYNMDMITVSFTGRPPLLSSAYCSTPMPLDLTPEELLLDKASLAKAVQALDSNGWKVQPPEIRSATFTRARALLSQAREEAFRIALGYRQTTTVDTILEKKTRATRTFESLPSILHYKPADLHDLSIDPCTLYARLIVYLEHLQTNLFIERLLLRHGKEDRSDLIAISFEMLSNTLPFWTHIDRLSPMRDDCEWLVMAYAAPAGGILCLELLKPTMKNGQHAKPEITRSSIIQKLSLLVGFLDWIKPCAPNADMCASCSVVIQRVLDRALNPAAYSDGIPDIFEPDTSAQFDFNFDLLDTFDWLRPEAA
ncbi:uncharacterized protein DNG_06392 [Cephalotrichum gorgonifer]|uniref:Xylanolytic transcriptional activator regulatory domain-containing protein n=1 Tax=Cephalotrichum gorgonifer TaxID=2041049 RepID=A0AAE8N1I1_9PEZI|nr:uncharacterized protein DNG_06392 [Cephalotrichum gorgonifer]